MHNNQTLEHISNSYIKQIKHAPYLSRDDELDCLKSWQEEGNKAKLDKLIRSHLRFVIKIAYGFRGYKLPIDDLISEGSVGLMQAINKYDPSFETRLSTYSMYWIKASISDYVMKNWSLVKLGSSVSQKKIFFNLRKLKYKLGILGDGELSTKNFDTVQTKLDVQSDTLLDMNRRLTQKDFSLDTPFNDETQSSFIETLTDSSYQPDIIVEKEHDALKKKQIIRQAMQNLSSREQNIIYYRKIADTIKTLDELAKEFNISRERIRQIEVMAEKKIKRESLKILASMTNQDNHKQKIPTLSDTSYLNISKDLAQKISANTTNLDMGRIKMDKTKNNRKVGDKILPKELYNYQKHLCQNYIEDKVSV